ncbi:hypothetical protein T12_3494 [Trichinella patagoniensis]|uniref:Secreted protein n=1 Tax=Trichinella patagoniensis TaxID=990121 RepID=A0A0V0ZTL6_9BILA|nr:hypothetical protein T12_3494 [Trichinella patagoniensis]
MTLSIVCLVVVSPNEFVCICGDVECKCKIEFIDLLLNERISFVNNGWREQKETTGANVGQNAKRHTTRLIKVPKLETTNS